jgi:predicted RNase H-like HicB family nuclease
MDYTARDYEVRIWYSDAKGDECFIAEAIDWATISAVGDTREEAAREIQIALSLALESAADAGVKPKTCVRSGRSGAIFWPK